MYSTNQPKPSPTNWRRSEIGTEPEAPFRLYNSFTKKKEIFVPVDGNEVRWYSCRPTLDDTSHMDHARYYISLDILHRVVEKYFYYSVIDCMNITDIDDEIIKQARQRHLIKKYMDDSSITFEKILEDCQLALKHVKEICSHEMDKDKVAMFKTQILTVENSLQNIDISYDVETKRKKLLNDCHDILSFYFDFNYSYTTNPLDNEVFFKYNHQFEQQFNNDIKKLNVLSPFIITRASEYVPEIIKYIEKIVENRYAYQSNSTVYFDTSKFNEEHAYPKLEADFILWKESKPGEPVWQSPWGVGRPGWHIQCSAMANTVFGPQFDIHTGGIDLKFAYHDNEIAEFEAYCSSDSCVNYFLHIGHLTINGCKMSKSLENVVTIQQALETYTPRQIRLLFLLHSWSSTFDFSEGEMDKALDYERMMQHFFNRVKSRLHSMRPLYYVYSTNFNEHDVTLDARVRTAKQQINVALCDSIDTPTVMEHIRQLVLTTNTYMDETINDRVLKHIDGFITHLMNVFGLQPSFY